MLLIIIDYSMIIFLVTLFPSADIFNKYIPRDKLATLI